ncbi:hypothetical protein F0L68_15160 [Solihabitans fulvus]|uniref:Acetate kinase n=1 Tax=Solihabitans fulvus TaxID=1892852 RepID=A0A5B2XFL3_9PSEU|nr:hypothetical protein F0L68_15160 [Solihabitans fulvus]
MAVRVYLHRLRREIAASLVSLDGLDALVLTGGVLEHLPGLRAELLHGLTHLGIAVDTPRNLGSGDRVISPPGAGATVVVLTAREDLVIARDVDLLLQRQPVGSNA